MHYINMYVDNVCPAPYSQSWAHVMVTTRWWRLCSTCICTSCEPASQRPCRHTCLPSGETLSRRYWGFFYVHWYQWARFRLANWSLPFGHFFSILKNLYKICCFTKNTFLVGSSCRAILWLILLTWRWGYDNHALRQVADLFNTVILWVQRHVTMFV